MTWKEKLHPQVSNAEIEVFKGFSQRGPTTGMVTQKTIILKSTIPDFQWSGKRKAIYLDGEQVHKNKENQDEEVTDLLEKRGWQVLRITYTAPLSPKKLTSILDKIQQFIGE